MYQAKIEPATFRYAQEKANQRLHLVEDFGNGRVSRKALCGRFAEINWRLTINFPMGQNCLRCSNSKYIIAN